MATLGEIIKKFRTERSEKISMDRFAEMSGLSKSYISVLENNRDPRGNPPCPSSNVIVAVANAMNMKVEDLTDQLDDDYPILANSQSDFVLSDEEKTMIINYRKADRDAQDFFRRLMAYAEMLNIPKEGDD